jgi:argininosuccinate lyase
MADKLWAGRFSKGADPIAETYTESVSFDNWLAPYDIMGSIAHVRMLAHCGIINAPECSRIVEGLDSIREDIIKGEFEYRLELEDVHTNIEVALTERIGPVGGRLHTGRSRNDQIALDMRLYVRDAVDETCELIRSLQKTIKQLAEQHVETVMPGMTHLQHAQPVSFAHHIMAYFWMFERDYGRFSDLRKRVNVMPLGAGALAGTSFPIDRQFVAKELGFDSVSRNSIDTVSDRDFVIEFCAAASISMMHVSRLAEEIVMWSSDEFSFVVVDEKYATGSSIMPQKRNPDVAELARGKTGRVYGALINLLTIMKALPLAYDRDMQEDKPPMFDAADTLVATLCVVEGMIGTLEVRVDRLSEATATGALCATDLADYLVRKGLPFRKAHKCVAQLVQKCVDKGTALDMLTVDELNEASELFEEDALECLSPVSAMRMRRSEGGTAPEAVRKQIEQAEQLLG